jgi:hypothetical protein
MEIIHDAAETEKINPTNDHDVIWNLADLRSEKGVKLSKISRREIGNIQMLVRLEAGPRADWVLMESGIRGCRHCLSA